MNEDSIRARMQAVLGSVAADIGSIRTGRATPSLVENLQVTAYQGQQRLMVCELATITVADPRTMIVDPWDKSIIGDIKKAIEASNVGLNPQIDGEIIRISLPPMTSEDREKYVRLLSAKLESGKIMIRQIRGDIMKDIKDKFEAKELSEDEKFGQEKRLQQITDEFVGKIDTVGDTKKQELLQV